MTQDDLKQISEVFVNRLKPLATKDDIKIFATKDDLKAFATKSDFGRLEKRFDRLDAKVDGLDVKVNELDKKINRVVAVAVGIRGDLKTDFATKNDLITVGDNLLSHIDGLAKNIDNLNIENVANVDAHKKFGERIGKLKKIFINKPVKV